MAERGAADRSRFVHTGLPELAEIPDESVDVVMTRSVLIYVSDNETAFQAFHRVIRPGGRLSIFEPINSFGKPEPAGVLWGFDISGLEPLAAKARARYRHYHPDPNPMGDVDERDLVQLAQAAGFDTLRLEYFATVGPDEPAVEWETLMRIALNPLVPPLGQILSEALDVAEHAALTERMRAGLGSRQARRAGAYLSALK